MVGDADKCDDQRIGGQGGQHLLWIILFAAAAKRQHAAMNVEARDGIHDGLRGDVDRHRGGSQRQRFGHAGKTLLQDQRRFDLETARRKQHVQHHLAFGDETALAAHEVALADGVVACNARIVGAFDADCGCRVVPALRHAATPLPAA